MPKVKLACSMGLAWPRSDSFCRNAAVFFRRKAVQQRFDMRVGITQLRRGRHGLFGFVGMCDQLDQHGVALPLLFIL